MMMVIMIIVIVRLAIIICREVLTTLDISLVEPLGFTFLAVHLYPFLTCFGPGGYWLAILGFSNPFLLHCPAVAFPDLLFGARNWAK